MGDVPQMSFMDKIKLLFTAKKALGVVTAGPKASWLTGEFWAKVAAAICTLWAGAHQFVPHPIDIYITVGLALWVSLERAYLKSKHMEMLVDLSAAPEFDMASFAQIMDKLVSKFPALAPAEATVIALAKGVKTGDIPLPAATAEAAGAAASPAVSS